jgi:hypothetical protein
MCSGRQLHITLAALSTRSQDGLFLAFHIVTHTSSRLVRGAGDSRIFLRSSGSLCTAAEGGAGDALEDLKPLRAKPFADGLYDQTAFLGHAQCN